MDSYFVRSGIQELGSGGFRSERLWPSIGIQSTCCQVIPVLSTRDSGFRLLNRVSGLYTLIHVSTLGLEVQDS